MENGLVDVVYGYPAVSAFGQAGVLSAAGLTSVFNPTAEQIRARGYNYNKMGNIAVFQVIGGSDAARCSFTYTQATARAGPIISAIITTGC
jgi:MSHA pilin protein MshA